MNPDNVGTLEACQRLKAAGIVLETDFCWRTWIDKEGTPCAELVDRAELVDHKRKRNDLPATKYIPAVQFAEVWRELPVETILRKTLDGEATCWIRAKNVVPAPHSTNPTDALIDLLILVREAKP